MLSLYFIENISEDESVMKSIYPFSRSSCSSSLNICSRDSPVIGLCRSNRSDIGRMRESSRLVRSMLLMLGDVREQAGAAEQINEYSAGRILFDYFYEVLCKHSFLSYEWKRCR